MIIDCISDLHGEYPKLASGDLLIVAGDIAGTQSPEAAYGYFADWLHKQNYEKKIFIAGNHDTFLEKHLTSEFLWDLMFQGKDDIAFLNDSGIEFAGFKIWGCPWTTWFNGVNPKYTAFMGFELELNSHFSKIPNDIDILITHSPPHFYLDKNRNGEHCGARTLCNQLSRIRPQLHVFGHIHECGGQIDEIAFSSKEGIIAVNASILNADYEHVNKPVRIILHPRKE